MRRAVLLLHTRPDGTSHFDWLVARAPGDGSPLVSFRLGVRPDAPGVRGFEAAAMPDHRARYPTYEGALTGDRGEVERLAAGVVERGGFSDRAADVTIRWGDDPIRYEGEAAAGGVWRFIVTPGDAAGR